MNLAVGFFDGVHLGHRRILAEADAVLTFRNHPATVLAPAAAPRLVMTAAARERALGAALRGAPGAAAVRLLDFTREFAALPPADFAFSLRREYPNLETLFCGPNWTFGARGAGSATFLRERGFHVETIPFFEVAGAPVSSTRIRSALAAGDLATANACLGRAWQVEGEVVHGKALGRALGFPTLNVRLPAELVSPPLGVYAVDTAWGRAVANWGCAPTLGARAWAEPILEVHLLERVPQDVPHRLAISFRRFLRAERRFPSLAALTAQIAADVQAARAD